MTQESSAGPSSMRTAKNVGLALYYQFLHSNFRFDLLMATFQDVRSTKLSMRFLFLSLSMLSVGQISFFKTAALKELSDNSHAVHCLKNEPT
jgi:hypothetical protein